MQYPIIDLIADAYLNNGWTGLDISTGKNLLEQNDIVVDNTLLTRVPCFIPSGTYTLSCIIGIDPGTPTVRVSPRKQDGTGMTVFSLPYNSGNRTSSTVTFSDDCYQLFFYYSALTSGTGNQHFIEVQIESGSQATPYEPYGVAKNDFPNRLKLPLPHYFQHPVIDALQRAAAGTQTADDTEILRHYLTPLGIGGI